MLNQVRTTAIVPSVTLSDEARALVGKAPMGVQFLGLLRRERLYKDAIRVGAHLLPKPEAVWWGCQCVWKTCRPQPSAVDQAALQAVIDWLLEPSDPHRRAAGAAADAADASAAACIAQAVFCSGGSLAPPGLPPVAPRPDLTARTVAIGVLAALGQVEPVELPKAEREFMAIFQDVADGRSHWDRKAAAAH